MNTPEIKKTKTYSKYITVVGYLALLLLILFVIWKIGNVWIERVVDNQQIRVSQSIINTVNEQAKLDLILPDMVFINLDTNYKKQLNDSISKQIIEILTKKYIKNEKVNLNEITFQPFFDFPDSQNRNGDYTLTKVQLEELKNHIQFLTSQIDKAVTSTKDEVGKDINRLNMWVSIWIGVIGFIGIFIPIVINIKSNEELKEINKKAVEAKTDVKIIKDSIKGINDNIKTVKDKSERALETATTASTAATTASTIAATASTTATTASETAISASTTANTAIEAANEATFRINRIDKLLIILNDLSKIKDIDPNFLLYNNQPFEVLRRYLIEIHTNLNTNSQLFSEQIVLDVLRQLVLRIYLIAPSSFISPANFQLLNQFSLDVSNIISDPLTEESYTQIISLLNILITNMEG